MFIDIRAKIKENEDTAKVINARVKELEIKLQNESCLSTKTSMQFSRKIGKALIEAIKKQNEEMERFL